MVRRSIPLGRRLRAVRGKILLALIWSAAAMACGVMLLIRTTGEESVAVAVTRTHPVRAPESGRLASLDVTPMQSVEAGAVLGRIEVPGLTQEIASAEVELKSLEAQLDAEEADRGRKFAGDIEEARASWLSARVELERESAIYTGLETEYTRLQTPGTLTSGAEIDRARSARDAAKATVDARLAEVAALSKAYDAARERAGGFDSAALKGAVEASAVRLEGLRILAENNVLRANVSGVVSAPLGAQSRDGRSEIISEAFPAPGQWVQGGMPVLMITEPSTSDAVVFVDVDRARALAAGALVSVRGHTGSRFDARVRNVGVAVEPVPMRQLRDPTLPEWKVPVTVDVGDHLLVPGESLSVEF